MSKRILCFISLAILAFSLIACGEKTESDSIPEEINVESDATETTDDSSYIEEEVVEEEIETDDSNQISDGNDVNGIETTQEVKTEYEKPWYGPLGTSDYKAENYPYVPTDDFWISEDYFDLKGWILANGGFIYYYSLEYDEQEEEDETTTIYKFSFVYRYDVWHIYAGEMQGFNLDKNGESNTGFMYMSKGESAIVKYNEYGCCIHKDIIEALDDTVKQIKENPEGPITEPSMK